MCNRYLFILVFLLSTSVFSANYYWIGGSGNWNDINHWRTSSGGIGIPAVIPGPTDDVFFDKNSGFTESSKTITMNIVGNCHNITFTGSDVAPVFTETDTQILNIYGSSVWQSDMTDIDISNIYYRNTNQNKTITSNGVHFGKNVYLEEKNTVELLDDFYCGSLELRSGTFNTNNNKVEIKELFYTVNNKNQIIINLGSSDIFFNQEYSYFYISSGNVTLNAGTSTIYFTKLNSSVGGINAQPGHRFYNVLFENEHSNVSNLILNGGTISNPLKFNKVIIKGSSIINGHNVFNELELLGTKSYLIERNTTQQIIKNFSIETKPCEGWTSLGSSAIGANVKVIAPSTANVKVSGVIIKNVEVSGGADFTANNSVDAGNNTGWVFMQDSGKNIYWVGGSGQWNDKTHWSATSGGQGGFCIPGPSDNVFFDKNSGFIESSKTVNLDSAGYVYNITFKASEVAPVFVEMDTQVLNIYGSSVWQSGMADIGISNIYYRNTNQSKTITSNGVHFSKDVYLEETNTIDLLDDFYCNSLVLQAGRFNTNNNKIRVTEGVSTIGAKTPIVINLGSSDIVLENEASEFDVSKGEVILNAGTSTLYFTRLDFLDRGINAQSGHEFYNVVFENQNSGIENLIIRGGTLNKPLKFNKVIVKGSGVIKGYNSFNELELFGTKRYLIESNTTQQIIKSLSIETKSCEGWTSLGSSTIGTHVKFIAPITANISVSGIIIQDIDVSGGANFTVNNSVDAGNNNGWIFTQDVGKTMYWVGGSGHWGDKTHWSATSGGQGGFCIPGPSDNVIFDDNSGFKKASKTVSLDTTGYVYNITFKGNLEVPFFTEIDTQVLNIYGSSVWQSGMADIGISNINYQNTNQSKTITSNGVHFSKDVYLEETNTIDLLDDFYCNSLTLKAGTFNTNNNKVRVAEGISTFGAKNPIVINLGSSDVLLENEASMFDISQGEVILNAGRSTIFFTGLDFSGSGINAQPGHKFHNIIFKNASNSSAESLIIKGGTFNKPLEFNKVNVKVNGVIKGYNKFSELYLNIGRRYLLDAGATQIVGKLIMSGTPCEVTAIQSTELGRRANLNVTSGKTNFNFVNIQDINASGLELQFGDKSTNNGNNNNMIFETYNPGSFNGVGANKYCHLIDSKDVDTYLLQTNEFYGNDYTKYQWYKLKDSKYDPSLIISTDSELDIRAFGYGTYKVVVNYSDGDNSICEVSNEIEIEEITNNPVASTLQTIIGGKAPVLSDIVVLGTDLKWYTSITGGNILPVTSVLLDNETYYVSQTINGCESLRTPVTVMLKSSYDHVPMLNPSIRLRVKR